MQLSWQESDIFCLSKYIIYAKILQKINKFGMYMTSEDIKHNFSENLIKLRKAKNLTQLELAEKLNYSDKAVSKWEVGSVLPDVETMTHIAEFFGITINDLIYAKKRNVLREFYKTHLFMTLLVSVSLWFVATIIFFVLDSATTLVRPWLTYIYTIPVNAIVLIVFSALWFKKFHLYLSMSALLWGIIVCIYLQINNSALWFIFIVGLIGQIVLTCAMPLKKKKIK